MKLNSSFLSWIELLCKYSHKDTTYYEWFVSSLERYPSIQKELYHYAVHGDFLGDYSISGYTVIDILIWQIDHFKSHMDRGEYDMQSNPEYMVLMAFDTFIKMEDNPEQYVLDMKSETGTDYAEKY